MANQQGRIAITAEKPLPLPGVIEHIGYIRALGEKKIQKTLIYKHYFNPSPLNDSIFVMPDAASVSLPGCPILRIIKLHCMTLGVNPSSGCSERRA